MIKRLLHLFGIHFYEDVTWWTRDFAFDEISEWRGLKCSVCQKVKRLNFIKSSPRGRA